MPSSGQVMWFYLSWTVSVFKKTKPEVPYSAQSPSPPPPNVLVFCEHSLTQFTTALLTPTIRSSHLAAAAIFQNMNLMFASSHHLLKTLSGLPLALRIKTEMLNAVLYSPDPPLRPHLNHAALCSLYPATLTTLQFHSTCCPSSPKMIPFTPHYAFLDSF